MVGPCVSEFFEFETQFGHSQTYNFVRIFADYDSQYFLVPGQNIRAAKFVCGIPLVRIRREEGSVRDHDRTIARLLLLLCVCVCVCVC